MDEREECSLISQARPEEPIFRSSLTAGWGCNARCDHQRLIGFALRAASEKSRPLTVAAFVGVSLQAFVGWLLRPGQCPKFLKGSLGFDNMNLDSKKMSGKRDPRR